MIARGTLRWAATVLALAVAVSAVALAQGPRVSPAQALDVLADDLARLSVRVNDIRDAAFRTEQAAAYQRSLMDAAIEALDAGDEAALAEAVAAMRVPAGPVE